MNRIVYKILFTAINFLITTSVFILVARNLGAEGYGSISYIFATYDFFIQIFMLQVPTAYIFFLSGNKYSKSDLNGFVSAYLAFVSVAILLVTIPTYNNDFGETYLWGYTNSTSLIFGSFLIIFITNVQNIFQNYSDATLQTVKSENSRFVSKLFLIFVILILSIFEVLIIETYLLSLVLSLAVYFIVYSRLIHFKFSIPNKAIFYEISKDFIRYVKPLVLFSFVGVFYIYFGKYVLQNTSGSIEQGYFGFAFQIAMLPVLIISPIMPIIMREIIEKYKDANILEVKKIFLDRFFKILPLFVLGTAFLIFNAEEIILFTVGKEFIGAKLSIQMLSIYSLLHIFGFFNSIVFLSTGRNAQYGAVKSLPLVIGSLYLAYIYFAGVLDASGLALVLVVIYFFQCLILFFLNIKFLEIRKLSLFTEFMSVISIIFLMVFLIDILDMYILYDIFMSLLISLLLNFVFKDYLGLRNIYKSFAIKKS